MRLNLNLRHYSSAEKCGRRAHHHWFFGSFCKCHGSAADVARLSKASSTVTCDDVRRPISTPSNTVLSRRAAVSASTSFVGREHTLEASLVDRQLSSASHSAARRRCLRHRRQLRTTTANRATVTSAIQASNAKYETVR